MIEIKLTLTFDEVNTILAGLLELPAKFSVDIINKIREQATPQVGPSSESK